MEHVGKSAIILPPENGDWGLAAKRLAGVPLLTRILLSVERAGVNHVTICAGEAAPRLQRLVAGYPLQSDLRWTGDSEVDLTQALRQNGTSPCFIIPASTVLNPATLTEMKAAFHPGATLQANGEQGPECPVVLRSPTLPPTSESSTEEMDLSGNAVCLDLTTATAGEATTALYRALGKPTDSRMIRWTRLRLSPLMRWITNTPLTPNHITLLGFLTGLLAIGSLWTGVYPWTVAGGVLFVVAHLIDHLDGMMARLKFQETRWGAWMDYTLDNVVHVGIFAAITRAVYLTQPEQTVLALGVLLLAGAVTSASIVAAHMNQLRRPGHRLLKHLMHRDFSLIVLLAALFDRLDWFLWAAAVGVNLFWPFLLYLLNREKTRATSMGVKQVDLYGSRISEG